jgi:hypothetical protein
LADKPGRNDLCVDAFLSVIRKSACFGLGRHTADNQQVIQARVSRSRGKSDCGLDTQTVSWRISLWHWYLVLTVKASSGGLVFLHGPSSSRFASFRLGFLPFLRDESLQSAGIAGLHGKALIAFN